MEFIDHTINWCRGEILEGKIILTFAAIIFIVGVSYAIWGSSPYAKAAPWALIALSVFAMITGIYLISTNQKRIPTYTTMHEENSEKFILAEKERTAAFIKWYPITQKIVFGLMIIGMLCMIMSHKTVIRTIGIGLMIFSLFIFIVDHFSEERALKYQQKILKYNSH